MSNETSDLRSVISDLRSVCDAIKTALDPATTDELRRSFRGASQDYGVPGMRKGVRKSKPTIGANHPIHKLFSAVRAGHSNERILKEHPHAVAALTKYLHKDAKKEPRRSFRGAVGDAVAYGMTARDAIKSIVDSFRETEDSITEDYGVPGMRKGIHKSKSGQTYSTPHGQARKAAGIAGLKKARIAYLKKQASKPRSEQTGRARST